MRQIAQLVNEPVMPLPTRDELPFPLGLVGVALQDINMHCHDYPEIRIRSCDMPRLPSQ